MCSEPTIYKDSKHINFILKFGHSKISIRNIGILITDYLIVKIYFHRFPALAIISYILAVHGLQ